MNEYDIYKYIEFIIFLLYLIFIFLSIQIWFLWKDINKNELKIKPIIDESFIKKNYSYISISIVFSMIHEFSEWASLPNAMVYYEFIEMLGLIFLLLVVYEWYLIFKKCVGRKSQPPELF